jgi:hypothetical protein
MSPNLIMTAQSLSNINSTQGHLIGQVMYLKLVHNICLSNRLERQNYSYRGLRVSRCISCALSNPKEVWCFLMPFLWQLGNVGPQVPPNLVACNIFHIFLPPSHSPCIP